MQEVSVLHNIQKKEYKLKYSVNVLPTPQLFRCPTWYSDLGLFLLGKSLVSVPERLQLKLTGVARCLQFQQQQDVIPEAISNNHMSSATHQWNS